MEREGGRDQAKEEVIDEGSDIIRDLVSVLVVPAVPVLCFSGMGT